MSYAEYQKYFEDLAEKESNQYDASSLDQILLNIKNEKYGETYQIWYSLAKKTTVEDVGWILFEILESRKDYLTRYHCASALLQLFSPKQDSFKAINLSGCDKSKLKENLQLMEQRLIDKIGSRPEKRSFLRKLFRK